MLGGRTVREWQEVMSSKEFGEWMAFDRISPGEPERGDIRTALLAATIFNAHKGRKGKTASLDDFLLKFKRRVKKPTKKTRSEVKVKLKSWFHQYMMWIGSKKK